MKTLKLLLLAILVPFMALSQTVRFVTPNNSQRDPTYNKVPVKNNDTLTITVSASGWAQNHVFDVEVFKKTLPTVKFSQFDSLGNYTFKVFISTVDHMSGNLYFGIATLPCIALDDIVGIEDDIFNGDAKGYKYCDVNGNPIVLPFCGVVIRSDGLKFVYQ